MTIWDDAQKLAWDEIRSIPKLKAEIENLLMEKGQLRAALEQIVRYCDGNTAVDPAIPNVAKRALGFCNIS